MVRELFEMARAKKACIIFFDEIDAVGGNCSFIHKTFHIYKKIHLQHLCQQLAVPQNLAVFYISEEIIVFLFFSSTGDTQKTITFASQQNSDRTKIYDFVS